MRVVLVIAMLCGTLGIAAVLLQIAVAQWTRLTQVAQIAVSLSKGRPATVNVATRYSVTLAANDQAHQLDELQQEVGRLRDALNALVEAHNSWADRVGDIKGWGGWLLGAGAVFSLAALGLSFWVAWATLPSP